MYELDPEKVYGFRLKDPVKRAELAEKMAQKRLRHAQNRERAAHLAKKSGERSAKIKGLSGLAGKRAIIEFIDGETRDLFVAGMTKYNGTIRPDYGADEQYAGCAEPDLFKNELVYRVPDRMDRFASINPELIESFRARTNEDMPLMWEGDYL